MAFLGIIGFPFALLLAWAFELTPQGIKRSEDVTPEDSITGQTAGRLNQATTALLVLAVVILLLDRQFDLSERWKPGRDIAVPETATTPEPRDKPQPPPVQESAPRSIAVLPFVNMSEDPSQEYFSDGISEELLNGLAKIRELRVAARTSSFAFKGKNQDITEIGEKLKVGTVLEGSVRKSGQRVRITAQLINVEDGYHLWSETYDRDLVDIFAVQDEISAAIVNALKVHLTASDEPGPRSPVDVQAYNFVLQARHNVRMRTKDALELAVRQYRQALEIDEDYAQAWAGMAIATSLLRESQYGDIPDEESYRVAQGYLDRAFAIDADLFEAYAGQALVYLEREQPEKGLATIEKALAINPSEGVLYMWKSFMLDQLGRYRDSTLALEKAYSVDPLHPSIRVTWPARLAELGRGDEAQGLLTPGTYDYYRAQWVIARAEGRWADQYTVLEEALAEGFSEGHRENLQELKFFTLYMELYEPAPDWGLAPPHLRGMVQAIRDPGGTIEQLSAARAAGLSEDEEHLLVMALSRKGDCAEVISLLEAKNLENRPAYGRLVTDHSDESYALDLAWCLWREGETERARSLARELIRPMQRDLNNGTPPDYIGDELAILQMLLGEERAAVGTLERLLATGRFYFREYYFRPYEEMLGGRADFQSLKARHLARVNAERASLGWPAVEDTGL